MYILRIVGSQFNENNQENFMAYKKTVKKYKNAKSTQNITKNNQNSAKVEEKTMANSKKQENQTEGENTSLSHEGKPQPRANSNLKEVQNQDTLAKQKGKLLSPIVWCVFAGIASIIASAILKKSVFNTSLSIDEKILLTPQSISIALFFVYYISSIIAICLITKSNKTDNTAFKVDMCLYYILLVMSFVISLMIYCYNLFLPACIISIITCIISIYLTYRYYVSRLASGILQTASSLILMYGVYITLAFTLSLK